MRKVYSFLTLVFILAAGINADAKILRVGYNGIPLSGVDYNSIDEANTAAAAGDTVQVYGDENGSIDKKLVIMGFGYNFDVHPNLQAVGTDAPSNTTIYFNPGSENSVIEGCKIYAYIYTSGITIRRCFGNIYLFNNAKSINNIKVISSVVTYASMQYNVYPCTNFQMYNCIISGSINFYVNGSSGSIINCVTPAYHWWDLNLNEAGFLVKNCILVSYNSSNKNTVWENNFFVPSQPATLPQGKNNRWGQSFTNIFNRLGGTSDDPGVTSNNAFDENYYVLKTGSPAINGGFNSSNTATDCGIFGGDAAYLYKISGVPPVPAIYKLTAPSGSAATTNPYNVNISVRSNN